MRILYIQGLSKYALVVREDDGNPRIITYISCVEARAMQLVLKGGLA